MYEQVEKTQVKKSQMAANAVSQRRNSNAPTSRFVDKRPEAIQMRKLRDLAKHSPQKATLRELHNLAAAHSVAQKKSNGKQAFVFVDSRPEAIQVKKMQKLIKDNPQAIQSKAFYEMAGNSPKTKQSTQLQAMVDNFTVEQQPIQNKENDHVLFSPGNSVLANLDIAANSFSYTASENQFDSVNDPVQMTRVSRGMTRHYNHHQEARLPTNRDDLISYVNKHWYDFENRGGGNRWVLELGVFRTKRHGGVWEAREWCIVMMGDTIVHFGPTG